MAITFNLVLFVLFLYFLFLGNILAAIACAGVFWIMRYV